MSETLTIPIYDPEQKANLIYTLDKMNFKFKLVEKRRKVVAIQVTYDEVIEILYLGMTVTGDMYGIFKTALTR